MPSSAAPSSPTWGKASPCEQHAAVAAQRVGEPARLGHLLDRHRVAGRRRPGPPTAPRSTCRTTPRTRSAHRSIVKHRDASSPHSAWGNPAPNPSSSGSRKCVCTSTITSPGDGANVVVASSGSVTADGGTAKVPSGSVPPDVLVGPVARRSSSAHAASTTSVAAAPADERRNVRRSMRWRRATSSTTSARRRSASRTTAERGAGACSPFDTSARSLGTDRRDPTAPSVAATPAPDPSAAARATSLRCITTHSSEPRGRSRSGHCPARSAVE